MRQRLLAALVPVFLATPAQALVVIGFEGVNATYPSTSYADILGFYSGGLSSQGTSGANLGASFAPNAVAVCLNALGGSCSNASRGGLSATSAQGGLGIGAGNSTYFDYPAGFTFAIGFRYAVAPGTVATMSAYSGLGGTGSLLAPPLVLLPGSPGCAAYNAPLCPMGPGGLFLRGCGEVGGVHRAAGQGGVGRPDPRRQRSPIARARACFGAHAGPGPGGAVGVAAPAGPALTQSGSCKPVSRSSSTAPPPSNFSSTAPKC